MSFSLIKILEDLRTTHGKKAMYVHFSEENDNALLSWRSNAWPDQGNSAGNVSPWHINCHTNYFMCQCATTSVRWPTFVECFETAPLQYESWCTLCFWLMVWLKITRRSQKCFVCLFDGPAYRRTCLAGTVVLPTRERRFVYSIRRRHALNLFLLNERTVFTLGWIPNKVHYSQLYFRLLPPTPTVVF